MVSTMSTKNFDRMIGLTKTCMLILGFYMVMQAMVEITQNKLTGLRQQLVAESSYQPTIALKTKQLDCLTKNIYWEAATEPFEGKVAVAQVTLNRVESGKFGDGICGVVYQKNIFYEKVICQFSWVCESNWKTKPVMSKHYAESEEVAKKVLFENFRLPSLSQALYYHADYVNPRWGKEKITKIGQHIFYK